MNCDRCGNGEITFYKQLRSDGVWVVTARCANGHHPKTGKPFYPISQFNISALPVLGSKPAAQNQPELFRVETKTPSDVLELVKFKQELASRFYFKRNK